MPTIQLNKSMSVEAQAILSALLYYDIFTYPLKVDEIRENCGVPNMSMAAVQEELNYLVELKALFKIDEFYGLQDDPELVARRVAGNKRAEKLMKRAKRMSRFIGRFPYVRAVCLSGSISKGYVDKDSDIDYFIITQPGRLWIARTFLIAFKKIFLLNSYKYFCVNYFVDTEHLIIEEQNRFTATELVTLKPMYGSKMYQQFYAANDWTHDYFPNYDEQSTEEIKAHKRGPFKATQEFMLNNRFGTWLDGRFMRLTMRSWSKKFGHFDAGDYDVAMKSRTYVSKHHPSNFQRKVIEKHAAKIAAFESEFNVEIEVK
jgi:predicted nucleotidyltransferase